MGWRLPWGTSNLPRRVLNRVALACAVVVVNVVLIVTVGMNGPDEPAAAGAASAERTTTTSTTKPRPYVAALPDSPPAPEDRPTADDKEALRRWSATVAERTGMPADAAAAYGRAEMWMRGKSPDCHVSWVTLAALGKVSSEHGTTTDEAGPMRVSGQVWSSWAARAAGDGAEPDRASMGDAALTVARALCGHGSDMRDANGWWRAVVEYTQSVPGAQRVFEAAARYANTAGE